MSTTTDVLSLFKYDPVADADSTFNITQGLNNNWDKLDAAILLAIAAAGAYNPEESYAVGDYCTYKGKLRKCSTAIPTGETWTEAHWTTTTVAAELAELSSQLSNAAQSTLGQVPSADLLSWADTQPRTGAFGINPAVTTEGVPAVGWYHGFLEVKQSGRRLTLTESSGQYRTWTNCTSSNQWMGWKLQALATPPQKFSLPLSAGWEAQSGGDAKYFKTQEDIVHVSMNVKSNAAVAAGDTIATLPAGFRPASQLKIPIICKVSGQSALKFGHFDVTTNGAIRIYDAVTGSEIVTEIAVAPFAFDAAG